MINRIINVSVILRFLPSIIIKTFAVNTQCIAYHICTQSFIFKHTHDIVESLQNRVIEMKMELVILRNWQILLYYRYYEIIQ